MEAFGSAEDMKSYFEDLNPRYGDYAQELWTNGLKSVRELAQASPETLQQSGITDTSHAKLLQKYAKSTGGRLPPCAAFLPRPVRCYR